MPKMNTEFKRGFTLVELLAVVGVMIIITTVVVSSSVGMSKSAAFVSAQEIPLRVLEYARQRACMDGKKTIVRFSDNDVDKVIRVFQAEGIITKVQRDAVEDRYSDVATFSVSDGKSTLVIQNFKELASGEIPAFYCHKIERNKDADSIKLANDVVSGGGQSGDAAQRGFGYPVTRFHVDSKKSKGQYAYKSSQWEEGDPYGFEIMPVTRLPKDFSYKSGEKKDFLIVFNPDGTSDTITFVISDERKDSKGKVTFKVENGAITQDLGV